MASNVARTAAKQAGKAVKRRRYATEVLLSSSGPLQLDSSPWRRTGFARRRCYQRHSPAIGIKSYYRLCRRPFPSARALRRQRLTIRDRCQPRLLSAHGQARLSGAHLTSRHTGKSLCNRQRSRNRSTEEFTRQLIEFGGQFFHAGSRDGALYQATATTGNIEGALDLILDTTFQPSFDEDLLASQKDAALYDNFMFNDKPEVSMNEKVLDVAWRGNTLGNPWPAEEAKMMAITPARLAAYHRTWYTPERMVIAAVGVEHEPFVRLVERMLEPHLAYREAQPIASTSATKHTSTSILRNFSTSSSLSATASPEEVDLLTGVQSRATASLRPTYTGGLELVNVPDAEFTRLVVGYESLPLYDPDLYALAVLHILLGGGSSFSSGGPGKGMYSRFYTDVLARYRIVDHCASLHSIFADAGLFGCHLAVTSESAKRAPVILAEALASTLKRGDRYKAEKELARARNQLQMTLLQALESRAVQVRLHLFSALSTAC